MNKSSGKVKILVVGGGGREHAIAWKLAQSDRVSKIFVTPGNGGTHRAGGIIENVSNEIMGGNSVTHIAEFAKRVGVSVVVVGPEAPLDEGIADELQKQGIPCFGPTKSAAQIEASKAFAKDFMAKYSIPTARYQTFTDFAAASNYIDSTDHLVVVKASGLAAGKGVVVPSSREEAKAAAEEILAKKCFGSAGDQLVLEELLVGLEVSMLAFTDGKSVAAMPLAQDHKRVNDGDEGLNTGGMGAFAPVPASILSHFKRYASSTSIEEEYKRLQEELTETVLQRCVDGMNKEGVPFVGVLFAGIMLTEDGPRVLEYNCRLGDPETEVLLPLLKTDLVEIVLACVEGRLKDVNVEWHTGRSAVTVVAASGGYPGKYDVGKPISGLNEEDDENVIVFHAGTSIGGGGKVLTAGGRVLAVTAVGNSLQQAVTKAYNRINNKRIHFDGIHYRKDIARKAFQAPLKTVKLAVLGSTRGTVMQAIIDAIKANTLDAEISIVVSNRSDAYILQRSKEHNLKHVCLPSKGKNKETYDKEMIDILEEHKPDLVLLIGYMRILSGLFVRHYEGRIYNVHPSLLPLFAGGMDLDVHKAVIEAKCAESGCTVHHVTEEVDAGPIIIQKRCPVVADETSETLKAKVQQLEGVAMIEAIKLYQKNQATQGEKEKITYGTAGVDIDAGDRFVERIKPMAKSTARIGADASLGGFGGLFDLKQAGFKDPILVSGTDGVGTKLKLAQQIGKHDTVGIDLVAMCVNDVLVQGAEPLFFLDYFATGHLDVDEASSVVSGIAAGCKESGCALVGGETAEMPGMYQSGEYDLAGFSVGAVERDAILPRVHDITEGDLVIGLTSSGIHSNGYSLVRHLLKKNADSINLDAPPPFDTGAYNHARLADALLAPTKLYIKPVLPLMKKGLIKAAAHITGGGLLDNVPRVLPDDKAVEIDASKWTVPGIFSWLSKLGGGIEATEMLRTFNMGIGMVLIIKDDEETFKAVKDSLTEAGEETLLLGRVVPFDPTTKKSDSDQVHILNVDVLKKVL